MKDSSMNESTIRVCLIPVHEAPQERFIPADKTLESLQQFVGGTVDILSVKEDGIDFWVNDEGLFTKPPNRAIYADAYMEEQGYLSQLDFQTVVKEGDLYTVLFGNIVAARHDEDGHMTSLTEQDIASLKQEYADPSTGFYAVAKIQAQAQQRKEQQAAVSLDIETKDARTAASELSNHPTELSSERNER